MLDLTLRFLARCCTCAPHAHAAATARARSHRSASSRCPRPVSTRFAGVATPRSPAVNANDAETSIWRRSASTSSRTASTAYRWPPDDAPGGTHVRPLPPRDEPTGAGPRGARGDGPRFQRVRVPGVRRPVPADDGRTGTDGTHGSRAPKSPPHPAGLYGRRAGRRDRGTEHDRGPGGWRGRPIAADVGVPAMQMPTLPTAGVHSSPPELRSLSAPDASVDVRGRSASETTVHSDTIGSLGPTTCPDSSVSDQPCKEVRGSETVSPTDTVMALECI